MYTFQRAEYNVQNSADPSGSNFFPHRAPHFPDHQVVNNPGFAPMQPTNTPQHLQPPQPVNMQQPGMAPYHQGHHPGPMNDMLINTTATPPPTLPVYGPDEYSYIDVAGIVQGPFGYSQLQQWIAQGHFTPAIYARRGNEMFEQLGEQGLMPYTGDENEKVVSWRDNANWYYVDRQGIQQGSFSYEQILNWASQNFLTPEILVRCGEVGHFTPLGKSVFMVVPQPGPAAPDKAEAKDSAARNQSGDSYQSNNQAETVGTPSPQDVSRLEKDLADTRNRLRAREQELQRATGKLHVEQEKNARLIADSITQTKKMEKMEKKSVSDSSKIKKLTAEKKKLDATNKQLGAQIEQQEAKWKKIQLYESAMEQVADTINDLKAKVKHGSNLSNFVESQKKLMATRKQNREEDDKANSTTSSSSMSWADAKDAEDEENAEDDGEEVVLLGSSGGPRDASRSSGNRPNNRPNNQAVPTTNKSQHHNGRRQWTPEELAAVEAATLQFGLNWAKVAEATGETTKECKKMYKYSKLKKTKNAGKKSGPQASRTHRVENKSESKDPEVEIWPRNQKNVTSGGKKKRSKNRGQ
jgi:hypothetical protein